MVNLYGVGADEYLMNRAPLNLGPVPPGFEMVSLPEIIGVELVTIAGPAYYYIYGSSRLGQLSHYNGRTSVAGTFVHRIANKIYEIADHLGNVKATVSDRLAWQNNQYDYVLKSSQDYYPFGMLMPTRTWDAESSYRFGFNGMEKDDEMKGAGNSYTTEFRLLDARLGRWLSPDPVPKYHESQYAWNTNNPIVFIDINGADSTQRATAVATAKKFVSKNPKKDGSLYGGKGTEPGTSTDCSGLISACTRKAGESPNKAVPNGQRKKDGTESGVLNIEDNCIEVKLQDVKV